jgi:MYXO-CTERM domain-containing protein
MKNQTKLAALFLALLPAAGSAQLTTIYTDTFSGSAIALNGATTTTGGGIWSANLIANQDGALVATGNGSALLPFSGEINTIYTLSLDIAINSGFYVWLGFTKQGLASPGANNATDRFNNATLAAYPALAVLPTGTINATELYSSLVGTTTVATPATLHNYKMVLDTTGDGSSFKASYYLDGVAFASDAEMDYANLSTMTHVGFSHRTSAGTVDNFSLTAEAVPEPAAAALLGLAGLALIQSRRRN